MARTMLTAKRSASTYSPHNNRSQRHKRNRNNDDERLNFQGNAYRLASSVAPSLPIHTLNPDVVSLMSRELNANDYNMLLALDESIVTNDGLSDIMLSTLPIFKFKKESISREIVVLDDDLSTNTHAKHIGLVYSLVDSDDENDTKIPSMSSGRRQNIPNPQQNVIDLNEIDKFASVQRNINSSICTSSSSSSSSSTSCDHSNPTLSAIVPKVVPKSSDQNKDKVQCCLCLEDYVTGDDLTTLPCLHVFHYDCVVQWLRNKGVCPIDRIPVFG